MVDEQEALFDTFFVLKGKSYQYSPSAFKKHCTCPVPLFPVEKIEVPDHVLSESLKIFIEALERPLVEINPSFAGDLLYLCNMFKYAELSERIIDDIGKSRNWGIIIDMIIKMPKIGLETVTLEKKIIDSISDIIKCSSFYALVPEILLRIVNKSYLDSNNIMEIIKNLRKNGKYLNDYLDLYSMIKYGDLSAENKVLILKEYEELDVSFPLCSFLRSFIDYQQKNEMMLNKQITDIKDQLKALQNSIQTNTTNISAEKVEVSKQIKELKASLQANSKDITETKQALQTNTRDISSLKQSSSSDKTELLRKISDFSRKISNIENDVRSNARNITDLQTDLRNKSQELATLQDSPNFFGLVAIIRH